MGVFDPCLLRMPCVNSPLALPGSFPVLDVFVSLRKDWIAGRSCIFPWWNHHFCADERRGLVHLEPVVPTVCGEPFDVADHSGNQTGCRGGVRGLRFRQLGGQDVPLRIHSQVELAPARAPGSSTMLAGRWEDFWSGPDLTTRLVQAFSPTATA